MSVLIKGGRIVTAADDYVADVFVDDERISLIGESLDVAADRVIDATGKYVLPGCVDPHTHLDMPFGGTVTIDDVESGQISAAFGGTTCHVDFIIQGQGQTFAEAFDTWRAKANGKQVIDMGYHMAVTDLEHGGSLEELATLPDQGITSYKLFMAYKGALMVDDLTLFRTMQVASQTGALVMVHAENGDVIDQLVREALEAGNTEPLYHALTRPPEAEGEATNRAIQLAHLAGAPLYVVHVTCGEAVEPIAQARERGWDVWGETCTQYFFNSLDDIAKPNFEGAKYVYSPPVRDSANWEILWNAVRTDALSAVSTDHCAFLWDGQKTLGRDDFSKIPNGGPGLEDRLKMIHEFGVRGGRLSLNRMVELLATNPAKLFGLYPRKGTVTVGSDADLVVFDPERGDDLRVDAPLEVGLQPVRGDEGDRRARGRPAARPCARRERRARRVARHRAVRQARPVRGGAAAHCRSRLVKQNLEHVFDERPDVFEAWKALNASIKANMDLRRYELATLAAARRLRSSYCCLAHGKILLEQFGEPVRDIAVDHRHAGLDELDVAVMDFAERVVDDATSIEDADRQRLRDLGLTDADILDVTLAAAARCFFSKTLDGAGALPDAEYAQLPADVLEVLVVGRPIAETAAAEAS
jgi:dihydropyrimidinase